MTDAVGLSKLSLRDVFVLSVGSGRGVDLDLWGQSAHIRLWGVPHLELQVKGSGARPANKVALSVRPNLLPEAVVDGTSHSHDVLSGLLELPILQSVQALVNGVAANERSNWEELLAVLVLLRQPWPLVVGAPHVVWAARLILGDAK